MLRQNSGVPLYIHFIMVVVTIINGGNYSIAKFFIPHYFSAELTVSIRLVSGCLAFWILAYIFHRNILIESKDWLRLLVCAFLGVAGNQLLFYNGMRYTYPINASLLMLSTPILIAVLNAWKHKKRLGTKTLSGMALGITGALCIIEPWSNGFAGLNLLGDGMILANAVFFALYVVLVAELVQKYPPLVVVKWMFLFGSIIVLVFTGSELSELKSASFNAAAWAALGYLIFFSTIFVYAMNTYIPSKTNPEIMGFYIYFQPLTAGIIATFAGIESFKFEKVIFGLLILWGVYWVNQESSKV